MFEVWPLRVSLLLPVYLFLLCLGSKGVLCDGAREPCPVNVTFPLWLTGNSYRFCVILRSSSAIQAEIRSLLSPSAHRNSIPKGETPELEIIFFHLIDSLENDSFYLNYYYVWLMNFPNRKASSNIKGVDECIYLNFNLFIKQKHELGYWC